MIRNDKIENEVIDKAGCSLVLLREDLRSLSGNKYFKLNLNFEFARSSGFEAILSFGGAYSNHIAALAEGGAQHGFKTVGVIRGEDVGNSETLKRAKDNGMELVFVTREEYRKKDDPSFLKKLEEQFGKFYLIPEGGSNLLGVEGCKEIVKDITGDFDLICVPCGTGATAAGIILSLNNDQSLLGFQVLKGNGLIKKNIQDWLTDRDVKASWNVNDDFHFGGYAKVNEQLFQFVNEFREEQNIQLDYVYTGKMMFGIFDFLRRGMIQNRRIVAVHTGGVQGNEGFEGKKKVQSF